MKKAPPQPVTVVSRVGNPGCIRFPPPVRKASGIKRGDRLTLEVLGDGSVVLERVGLDAGWMPMDEARVEGCACQNPPASCGGAPGMLTVGWSYVRLDAERAEQLGLVADAPIRLVAEPEKITVALERDRRDLAELPRVPCPP
jgi:antitoxin component of MazEF toxin-antitoxin module